jgi:hypothetical protein
VPAPIPQTPEEQEPVSKSFPVDGAADDENLWGAQPFCTLSALVVEKSSHKFKYN